MNACYTWNIFDANLTTQDIDRLFIATNYEETDLENNDDNSLCRYEFSEIAARIGREKYFNKGLTDTIAEGTRRFIEESMLPNTCEKMPNQEFRENRLWVLEVDDLLKANKTAIDELFTFAKTGAPNSTTNTKNVKMLMMSDMTHLIAEAGFTGVENAAHVGLAYSLSK